MRYVAAIGMVIVVVVAFVAGLYISPLILPQVWGPEDPIWDRVVKSGKIRVGTEPGWPPYEFLSENGDIIGFEIELMETIADELGLTVE